jgi:hypothetical protein
MRRRSLQPDQPLLVGRLDVVVGRRGLPVLYLDVWCPWCKRTHTHTWGSANGKLTDEVEPRGPHCGWPHPAGLLTYFVGLDPTQARFNRTALRRLVELRGRWERRQAELLQSAAAPPGTPTA